MASSSPPYFTMDSDHRGASVVIAAFSLIIYTVSMAAIRLCVNRKAFTEFHAEDIGTAVALILSIASYLLFYRAVPTGLGSHQATLSTTDASEAFRMLYAAQMLGVGAIWTAKLSAAALHWGVEFNSTGRLSKVLRTSFVVAVLWGPVCLALTANQCFHVECKEHSREELAVVILNMASDVWLAIAPLRLVHHLTVPLSKKVRVGLLFAGRLIVPCVATGQIISLRGAHESADKTFAYAPEAIWSMMVVFFSVLASVVPRTQRFWGGRQSGGAKITGDEDELDFIKDWKNRLVRSTIRDVASWSDFHKESNSSASVPREHRPDSSDGSYAGFS